MPFRTIPRIGRMTSVSPSGDTNVATHEEGCRRFRDDHAPNNAETLAQPAAACLTQGAPREKQGETDTDGRFTASLRMNEERQEQEVAHGVAVSNAPIARSRLKPRPSPPRASAVSREVAEGCCGTRASKIKETTSPTRDIKPTTGRQATMGSSSATIAGKVAFPRSPAKL